MASLRRGARCALPLVAIAVLACGTSSSTSSPGGGDPGGGGGPDATVAGSITTPNPTIRSIAVEWAFTGDANANGKVSVRYRPTGGAWKTGMPLRRIPARTNEGFTWTRRHSGSLFDLAQGTTYEIELTLTDADGGSAVRTTTATTRTYPAPMSGATIRPATPGTLATVLGQANAGDVVELATGAYSGFVMGRSGTAGHPIVIRPASGAAVTVNGTVNLDDRAWVHLQGLTINGMVRLHGSNHMAILGNTIHTTGDGIVFYVDTHDNYVADNVVSGVTTWAGTSFGVSGTNTGEGIQLSGPGHVVEHNRVSGFRDCISLMEEGEAVDQWSIDIADNDLSICADDAIEADFCFHNCRVVRNRITNAFMGVSSQPSLGGPTYFIRNVMYNPVLNAFKLLRGSDGDVLLHNTVVKNGDAFSVYAGVTHYRQLARNNLFLGGAGGTWGGYANGSGRVISLDDADLATQDLDYDAYGSTAGTFTGRIATTSFSNPTQLRANTTEKHAVQVALDVFATPVAYPASPVTVLATPDLRISGTSAAAYAGVVIPNVNDGFPGAAPSIGAYEPGDALPEYGPRAGGVPPPP